MSTLSLIVCIVLFLAIVAYYTWLLILIDAYLFKLYKKWRLFIVYRRGIRRFEQLCGRFNSFHSGHAIARDFGLFKPKPSGTLIGNLLRNSK